MSNRKDTGKSDDHGQSNLETNKNEGVLEYHPIRDSRPPPSPPEDSDKPSGVDDDV